MTGPHTLRRGQHPDHRTAQADRFWRRMVAAYGLALFAATCVIQLCGGQ